MAALRCAACGHTARKPAAPTWQCRCCSKAQGRTPTDQHTHAAAVGLLAALCSLQKVQQAGRLAPQAGSSPSCAHMRQSAICSGQFQPFMVACLPQQQMPGDKHTTWGAAFHAGSQQPHTNASAWQLAATLSSACRHTACLPLFRPSSTYYSAE